jgi:SAM-dependent methyltransferase
MPLKTEFDPRLAVVLRSWWNDGVSHDGRARTVWRFLTLLWNFVRASTPEQRRRRYGDAEYDWQYRVNTTSATVGWRERLLGQFLSPYQATEPALFCEMLERLKINFHEFTFIDLGSGKGRALLMAADFPFRRILGVEVLPSLHRVAQENIRQYKSDSQKCFAVQSLWGDARNFAFPPEPTVLYLFNPLPEPALAEVVARLEKSLRKHPRALYVLYHNPLLEVLVTRSRAFEKIGSTHQYSIYAAASPGPLLTH